MPYEHLTDDQATIKVDKERESPQLQVVVTDIPEKFRHDIKPPYSDGVSDISQHSITVDVTESFLYPDSPGHRTADSQGNDNKGLDEKDKFIAATTPQEALDMAAEIVHSAPAFDGLPSDILESKSVSVEVKYTFNSEAAESFSN
jgi:hypothetical protein